eukprot:TRINITY_DN80460_c0_g1_i1.p1 TRINITY_DN80460_c0_g1~~TRINITY_DN80460_c0_g1_i1.p1  ORF type:complete len:1129 (-),score=394.60 TRINITY_DN80460_c0_g1_i1:82-3468(-)
MGKEKTILKIFWDLASAKSEVRVVAAAELVSALQAKKETEALEPQDIESKEMSMMEYSVQRLVRGLSSSRRGAREGFSIALAEVLGRFSEVSTESILNLMETELSLSGQLKPSEERDLSFGRLFCIGALLQGGRLAANDGALASRLLQDILSNSKRKSYMSQLGIKLVQSILENVESDVFLKDLMPILKPELTEKLSSYTANQISLAALVEDQLQSHGGAPLHKFIPSFHSKGLFHPSNFAKMEAACMDSTVGVHPNVHIMWDFVMKRVYGGVGGRDELDLEMLKMIWSKLVEDKMVESTPERQFLALQIMIKLLTHTSPLSADVVSTVFSPKVCKLLVRHASDKKSLLHGVVRLTTSSIERVFAHEDVRIREALVDHLRKSEDNLLAEMLGSIFASTKFHEMNTIPHDEYIAFLEKSLMDLSQPVPILLWFVDELYHCVTVRRSIVKEDETEKFQRIVEKILNVLWDVEVKVGAQPEVETVAKRVKNRLSSAFVAVLSSSHAKDTQASSLALVALKTNAKAVLSQSFSEKEGSGERAEDDGDEKSNSLKQALWERFGEYCETADKLAKRHKDVLARSFEWLFSHLILFCDDVEAEMDREDVFVMFENMVGAYTKHAKDLKQKEKELKASAKKKKTVSRARKTESVEDEEEEPEPVDVVVDILVQCMSMSSNLLRQLSVRVFKGVANLISDESLEILAEALQPKLPEEEEMEEENDEDEDGEDEADDAVEKEEEDGDAVVTEMEIEEGVLPFVEGEGGYDDDDEVELDDDEMLALDKVLAKKVRALIGGSQKGAMESKFRILDLMEVFFQENKSMRQRALLVLPCLGSMQNVKRVVPSATDEMVLGYQQRMTKLLKKYFCKNDANILSSLSSSADSMDVIGSVMRDVVEFISHAGRQYPLEAGTACLIHLMKGEISFLRAKELPIASSSSIATLKSALIDMSTRKRTHMRPDLLQNLIQRWPSLGWHLLPTIVEQLEVSKMGNFRRMQLLRVSLPLFSNSLCREAFNEEFNVKELLPFDAILRSFLPKPTSSSFTKKDKKVFSQLVEAVIAYASFIVSLKENTKMKKKEKQIIDEILSAWQEALKGLEEGVETGHPLTSMLQRVENAFHGVGDRKRRRKSHKTKKALD